MRWGETIESPLDDEGPPPLAFWSRGAQRSYLIFAILLCPPHFHGKTQFRRRREKYWVPVPAFFLVWRLRRNVQSLLLLLALIRSVGGGGRKVRFPLSLSLLRLVCPRAE